MAWPPLPHKWVVGSTFEWEFDLPMPVNAAYQRKPEPKPKAKKTRKAAKARTAARGAAEPATTRTLQQKASRKPKRVRLTPEERKERTRGNAPPQNDGSSRLSACAKTAVKPPSCAKCAAPTVLRSTDNRGSVNANRCKLEMVRAAPIQMQRFRAYARVMNFGIDVALTARGGNAPHSRPFTQQETRNEASNGGTSRCV